MKVCDINQVDYLITELPAKDKRLQPYRKKGNPVILFLQSVFVPWASLPAMITPLLPASSW